MSKKPAKKRKEKVIHMHAHTHGGILSLKGNLVICDKMDESGGCYILSEVSQAQKENHLILSLIHGP